jgi:carbamoyltransferase
MAIVDPAGVPCFAEAAERYLQCKRAYNCPPDDLIRVPELIREHCPPDAEIVLAISWSTSQLSRLELAGASCRLVEGVSLARDAVEWPFPNSGALALALRNSLSQAGLNLATTLQLQQPVVVRRYDHHLTHAASAVYTSPFDECVVAVVDGFGERCATSCYYYADGRLTPLTQVFPESEDASLGFFYAQLCALCGFDPTKGEEWKVMGLAGYGSVDPELYSLLRPLLAVHDLRIVAGCSAAEQATRIRKLRAVMRQPGTSPLDSANLARTGQEIFEEVMTELLEELSRRVSSCNLALAGGCALNSSYNGRILERTPFQRLHVPCAPGDDGAALGAALLAFNERDWESERRPHGPATPYLGSSVSTLTLRHMVDLGGLAKLTYLPDAIHERAAQLLADGNIIGWMQGRAEFGPRALGNRSVLADPRPPGMKDLINRRVKFREEFRPFAPSILDERGDDYFECYASSPYMERTLRFRPEVVRQVPAVVHVDGTGRVHSVRRDWNARYYDLIRAFAERTGVPLVLNTSLNVMGRPMVHSLEDALGMFFTTGLNALVVEDYLIEKQRVHESAG